MGANGRERGEGALRRSSHEERFPDALTRAALPTVFKGELASMLSVIVLATMLELIVGSAGRVLLPPLGEVELPPQPVTASAIAASDAGLNGMNAEFASSVLGNGMARCERNMRTEAMLRNRLYMPQEFRSYRPTLTPSGDGSQPDDLSDETAESGHDDTRNGLRYWKHPPD